MAWEINFLDFLQTCRTPVLDKIMVFLSTLGNAGILWMLVAVLFLIPKKYRWHALQMMAAMMLTFIVGNLILKNAIGRARPWTVSGFDIEALSRSTGLAIPHDKSFPSGHTMNGIVASVTIFFRDKRIGIPAIVLAVLIAFSRMYNYCHFPTDVLGGLAIGLCAAIIVNWFFWKMGWKDEIVKVKEKE